MCDTLQAGRRSAFLWLILAVTTLSLQVIGVTAHHHSAAQHAEQRRLHQQHESFGEGHHHRKPEINKSSKMWLINSYPDTQPMSNGWAFREWHNHLMTSYAPPTTTTTTTTTTPRTILSAKTPFPSLWNYAPKKGTVQQSHSNSSGNRTATRGLSPKHGRHVCVESRPATTLLQPVATRLNTRGSPCLSSNQICGDDLRRRKPNNIVYKCCPGWEQMYKHSRGCNRATCDRACRNGGKCLRPNVCQCPAGWTGDQCQEDIDECAKKVCDQTCTNTLGSFQCSCRTGFQLQEDRTSCKSTDSNHVALEASEMNGEDIDLDEIDHRLRKLERSLGPGNTPQVTSVHLDRLLNRVTQLEENAKRTDGFIQHLFKCQRYPNFC